MCISRAHTHHTNHMNIYVFFFSSSLASRLVARFSAQWLVHFFAIRHTLCSAVVVVDVAPVLWQQQTFSCFFVTSAPSQFFFGFFIDRRRWWSTQWSDICVSVLSTNRHNLWKWSAKFGGNFASAWAHTTIRHNNKPPSICDHRINTRRSVESNNPPYMQILCVF